MPLSLPSESDIVRLALLSSIQDALRDSAALDVVAPSSQGLTSRLLAAPQVSYARGVPASAFASTAHPASLLSSVLRLPTAAASFAKGRRQASGLHELLLAASCHPSVSPILTPARTWTSSALELALLRERVAAANAGAASPLSLPVAAALPEDASDSAERVTRTLRTIGSKLRLRSDPYIDCAPLKVPHRERLLAKEFKGIGTEPFPQKVFRMLSDADKEGFSDIVSFLPHGRAFRVKDTDRFVKKVMPRYFQQSKFGSFTRQLNLWGFFRVSSGPDVGAFYHELFLRGRPELSLFIKRVGVPSSVDRRRVKKPASSKSDSKDPDFNNMAPVG